MPRWFWWAPLAVLVAGIGAWGFRWGWIAATITETDVIVTYAAQYLEQAGPGARLTDCSAVPGKAADVWIRVQCRSAQGAGYDYPVDRFGRLLEMPSKPAPAGTPQT